MNTRDFATWLSGYLWRHNGLTAAEVGEIRGKLADAIKADPLPVVSITHEVHHYQAWPRPSWGGTLYGSGTGNPSLGQIT